VLNTVRGIFLVPHECDVYARIQCTNIHVYTCMHSACVCINSECMHAYIEICTSMHAYIVRVFRYACMRGCSTYVQYVYMSSVRLHGTMS